MIHVWVEHGLHGRHIPGLSTCKVGLKSQANLLFMCDDSAEGVPVRVLFADSVLHVAKIWVS